jgi:hypothetical protein
MITYGLTAYVGHGDGGADLVVNCVELGQHDPVNRVRIVLQWDNSLGFEAIPTILSLKKSLRTRMKKMRYPGYPLYEQKRQERENCQKIVVGWLTDFD